MTDEELDAVLMVLDYSKDAELPIPGSNAFFKVEELVGYFSALRAQLAEARVERDEWKEAATARHPNPADHRYWEGRYRDEKARADRAEQLAANLEAALAAQIEVDAGIADMLAKSAEAAMQLATDDDHSVKVGVASQKAMAQRISALIRNQPRAGLAKQDDCPRQAAEQGSYDRTALERHDAKTREKALREAVEILDDEGWLVRGLSKHRILALITEGEKPNDIS